MPELSAAKYAPPEKNEKSAISVLSCLKSEFEKLVHAKLRLSSEFIRDAEELCSFLATREILPKPFRETRFFGHLNWKFRLNADALATFFSRFAAHDYTFHYHQKRLIERGFNEGDWSLVISALEDRKTHQDAVDLARALFTPISHEKSLHFLRDECAAPTKLRKDKGDRDIEQEILEALFAAYLFLTLPPEEMHSYFDRDFSAESYDEEMWYELHRRAPNLFKRDCSLAVLTLDDSLLNGFKSFDSVRASACDWIETRYSQVNNYGYIAILVHDRSTFGHSPWELASDLILFAEKHGYEALSKAYFRPERIASASTGYIQGIDVNEAQFSFANYGFTYKDCFVVTQEEGANVLVLLLQKNHRDETVVPCPTCRSSNVEGNSYPSLGVRSWECRNRLCPDRSKYNRGKRYSFRALLMQQAITDERNEISSTQVKRWMRDVVSGPTRQGILEMLIKHYSLSDDVVHFWGFNPLGKTYCHRKIINHRSLVKDSASYESFSNSPLFKRYVVTRRQPDSARGLENMGDQNFTLYCGDAAVVLRSVESNSIDGGVTSPPYYNAREYSQWPNIYCYLHDMYNINTEVFRVLKPGACYLYNIFDYFDNERTVADSAMGEKRMILSAYTTDLFRRIGFEIVGNIVWDKGDIEGKRGFNAGNFSPYYQAPFNCWEHILVFRKPKRGNGGSEPKFPAILRQKPVFKIVKGTNEHGHTAPFPDAIPELLASRLTKGSVILDPFAGSCTTGRVAVRYGCRGVCVEALPDYCELGLKKYREERNAEFSEPRLLL